MGKLGSAAFAVAAVLAVTSCSGGEKVAVEGTPAGMRAAASATIEHRPSRFTMTMTMTTAGRTVTLPADGQFDVADHVTAMHMDMSQFVGELAPDRSIPEDVASSLADLHAVLSGTTLYLRFPSLAQAIGRDAQWIKMDVARTNQALADLLGSQGLPGDDPTAFVRFLAGTKDVQRIGTEDAGGTSTTHFRGTYTMRGALASAPADQRDALQRVINSFGASEAVLDVPIPFDAWVDDDGLMRRMHTRVDASRLGTNRAAGDVEVELELSGFGEAVHLDVPSDQETVDVSGMLDQMQSTSSSAIN